jgi:hypothetical protein
MRGWAVVTPDGNFATRLIESKEEAEDTLRLGNGLCKWGDARLAQVEMREIV